MVELCTVSRLRNTSVADRASSIAHWRPPNARLLSRTEGEDVVCERMCAIPDAGRLARSKSPSGYPHPARNAVATTSCRKPKGALRSAEASLCHAAPANPCQGVRWYRWSIQIHRAHASRKPLCRIDTGCNDVNNTPFTRNLYRTAERKRAPLYERCGPWRSPQRSWLKGDTVKLKEGRFDG